MQRQGWYIGYMRVSTQEQARNGVGFKAQPRALEAWAERQGVELRLLYERGCSGKRGAKRPKLDAALASLHAKDGPEGLVVAKLDRLSRSTVDFGLVLERAQKRGWRVVLLDMDVDTSTPQGEMLAGMLVVAAQFERRLIALRTKDALADQEGSRHPLRPILDAARCRAPAHPRRQGTRLLQREHRTVAER